MAGYSGTPLHRKLGIKPGYTIALLASPPGWTIADLPDGVRVTRRPGPGVDLLVAFFRAHPELERALPSLVGELRDDAALWIAWPRKASGHVSDITDNRLRDTVLPTGLVDTKVAALDEDWSGLKFVRRRKLRGRAAP